MRNQSLPNTVFPFCLFIFLLNKVRVPSRDLGWVAFSSCWAGLVVMLSQSWFLLCLTKAPRSWQSGKLGQPGSRNQVLRPKPSFFNFLIFGGFFNLINFFSSLMDVDFASLL